MNKDLNNLKLNRLSESSSPYLIQHQHNPVDWYEWCDTALNKAKQEDKPIFLSIGYSACHWCHVMAHECFEDDDIAKVLNEHYVSIKVDREERPDIDTIYMSALHHLGEQGGWPISIFLDSNAKPFWGGTYFPKHPKFGRPGFLQILNELINVYKNKKDVITHNTLAITERIRHSSSSNQKIDIKDNLVTELAPHILNAIDKKFGGLNGAPKFPQTTILNLLFHQYLRTRDKNYLEAVVISIEGMIYGGIHDHLAGGFSRYSVDHEWLAPHFEKMLYDNALLLELFGQVYKVYPSPVIKTAAIKIESWLEHEMTSKEGMFYSALDADSEGEEGKFYVWSRNEIFDTLGEDKALHFCEEYDVSEQGNWEGKNILNRRKTRRLLSNEEEIELKASAEKLLEVRSKRVRPGLDDKILTDWNGLMISSLIKSSRIFDQSQWIEKALSAFNTINSDKSANQLIHSQRNYIVSSQALLTDYAFMIKSALVIYEETQNQKYLEIAQKWSDELLADFSQESGGFYLTSKHQDNLLVRTFSGSDDAIPNGNAMMAENLNLLELFTGDLKYRQLLDDLFLTFGQNVNQQPMGHIGILNAYEKSKSSIHVILVGKEKRKEFTEIFWKYSSPFMHLQCFDSYDDSPHQYFENMGETTTNNMIAHICQNNTCSLPINDPIEFEKQLNEMNTRYQ